ncbi:hypothetical protein OH492_18760 [Vibrio chagasii]|nr:hypothetical protein [Vibrio chagasii]
MAKITGIFITHAIALSLKNLGNTQQSIRPIPDEASNSDAINAHESTG